MNDIITLNVPEDRNVVLADNELFVAPVTMVEADRLAFNAVSGLFEHTGFAQSI